MKFQVGDRVLKSGGISDYRGKAGTVERIDGLDPCPYYVLFDGAGEAFGCFESSLELIQEGLDYDVD